MLFTTCKKVLFPSLFLCIFHILSLTVMRRFNLLILALLLSTGLYANELIESISSFQADRSALARKYSNDQSGEYYERMDRLYSDWLSELKSFRFNELSEDGKLDYILFRNTLEKQQYFHRADWNAFREVKNVVDFAGPLEEFYIKRRMAIKLDAQNLAAQFTQVSKDLRANWDKVKAQGPYTSWQKAERAADVLAAMRRTTAEAYRFYFDYDPDFTWWMKEPWARLEKEMQGYEEFLRGHFVNTVVKDDGSGIIGRPIGKAAIEKELEFEFIPYTPEDLIAEAEKQFAWCEAEMLKASRELGYGDDWKAALEHVKNTYPPPGEWPGMAAEMAVEAVEFLEERDIITIPELAKETWRTSMMSAAAQRVSPFFLGGEVIQISYPTSEMTHEEKMMSMRGNNPHFSRATVQHELIPGHHLQQFMNQRNKPHRSLFRTAFWTEGWALYWEFNLWDKNFPRNAEDKIGMLFWRMHRCARIIFSLSYHMELMTPQECIDFLVDRVGHEYANAEAEVRRSFTGRYGPLYQIAYMIGGLQFYAMKAEMVDSGKMKEKDFHDFILKHNSIPVELVRLRMLGGTNLKEDYRTSWKFLGS